jgi:Polycystin cation channel
MLENSAETDRKRYNSRDTSFCALLFLILLLTMSIDVIVGRRQVEDEYWIRKKIENSLNPSGFNNIVDSISAYNWTVNSLATAFFPGTSNSINNYYQFVGPLVIRQGRSKQVDCPRSDLGITSSYKCFYTNVIGSEKFTDDIGIGPESWRVYQTDTGFKNSYKGEFGTYDSTGYVQTYNVSEYNYTSFISTYNITIYEGWITSNTRVIFIGCNLYQPTYDMWVSVNIIIELNTNGLAYPSQFVITPLQPNLYSRSPGANVADIFKIIFSLHIVYIYIGNVLEIKNGKRNINYAFSFQGLMDILLVGITILSVTISLWINQNETNLFFNNKFVDLSSISSYYKLYFNVCSMNLGFIIVRIVLFMTVNMRIYILVATIEKSAKNMISFLIIFVPILMTCAMIAQSTWGIYEYLYHSYTYSNISLVLISLGHWNFEKLILQNEGWSILFLLFYFNFIVFFLLYAFMGVYMDAYKSIRIQQGYIDNQTTWGSKELINWLFDWLPSNIKKFLEKEKKKEKFKQEEDDDLEDDEDEKDKK